MLNKKILFSLLFIGISSLSFAENISDEDMKKALEGITQIRVMEASEPKVISEVIVTEKVVKQTHKKKTVNAKVTKKKVIKKSTKKATKKKIYKKKTYKKKEVAVDLSELKEVQTLGVVSTSEPFELNQ